MEGDYDGAIRSAESTLAAEERVANDDPLALADALDQLGSAHWKRGNRTEAKQSLERALELQQRSLGDSDLRVAQALDRLGRVQLESGELAEASYRIDRALAIRKSQLAADDPAIAESRHSLGELRMVQGRFGEAELEFRRALEIFEMTEGPDALASAAVGVSLARSLMRSGRFGEAEFRIEHALSAQEHAAGMIHPVLGLTLFTLAELYIQMGDCPRAIVPLERAIEIDRQSPGPTSLAYPVLVAQQICLGVLGEHDRARAQYLRLRQLVRSLSTADKLVTASRILRVESALAAEFGVSNAVIRRYGDFGAYLEEKLGPFHPITGRYYAVQAQLYATHEKPKKATEYFERALMNAHVSGVPALKILAAKLYAGFLFETGETQMAILFWKQAVSEIQFVGAELGDEDPELRSRFMRGNRPIFESLAGRLIEAGRLGEAQSVLSMLKENEYSEFIQRSADEQRPAGPALTPTEQSESRRYRAVADQIARLGREYEMLRTQKEQSRHGVASFRDADARRVTELRELLTVARVQFQTALSQARTDLRDSGRQQALESMNLDSLRSLQDTLRVLGRGVTLIHYLVTTDRLHILVTTSATQFSRSVEVAASELNATIHRARTALRTEADPRQAAADLYRFVLQPIRIDLDTAGTKHLMVSLDSALRYVPFASLYDPSRSRYLIEDFSVSLYLEAARNTLERVMDPSVEVAGFGVQQSIANFSALPSVKRELESIVRTGPGDTDGVMNGVILMDDGFNFDSLLDSLESGYEVIHIASHFEFNPGTVWDSYLLLGDGQILTLGDIRARNLPFDAVDMLTLSACDTALGTAGDGREIEGLGTLALKQGATSVVATVWGVDDDSTALFMESFYDLATGRGRMSKAEAMRTTQLSMLHGRLRNVSGPVSAKYQHPFHWAPFVLIGNWR